MDIDIGCGEVLVVSKTGEIFRQLDYVEAISSVSKIGTRHRANVGDGGVITGGYQSVGLDRLLHGGLIVTWNKGGTSYISSHWMHKKVKVV